MSGSPYRLKDDPHSSHSVILARLGEGRGRRALDVGAADGFLAERLTAQGWSVTALERDPELAARARGRCKEIVVADLESAPRLLHGPSTPSSTVTCSSTSAIRARRCSRSTKPWLPEAP